MSAKSYYIAYAKDIMRTSFIYMVVVMSLLAVAGCGLMEPKKEVVTKTEYQMVEIPERLVRRCKVSQPPRKDIFVKSSKDDREEQLTLYALSLLGDLDNCNTQIAELKKLIEDERKIVIEANKK